MHLRRGFVPALCTSLLPLLQIQTFLLLAVYVCSFMYRLYKFQYSYNPIRACKLFTQFSLLNKATDSCSELLKFKQESIMSIIRINQFYTGIGNMLRQKLLLIQWE